MSAFETVFTLLGLVLGLAIAEILGGFANAFQLKRTEKPVRIGWLTPLLGLFVIVDLVTFWLVAWDYKDALKVDFPTLGGILLIVGVYYIVASLIFPNKPEEWPDYDGWYDRQKRMVLGGMLFCNVGVFFGTMAMDAWIPVTEPAEGTAEAAEAAAALIPSDASIWVSDMGLIAILAILAALIAVRNRRINLVLLAVAVPLLAVVSMAEKLF
jgi:hypothetical protein